MIHKFCLDPNSNILTMKKYETKKCKYWWDFDDIKETELNFSEG